VTIKLKKKNYFTEKKVMGLLLFCGILKSYAANNYYTYLYLKNKNMYLSA